MWIVFGTTLAMTSAQTGLRAYYISGLLNTSEDTVGEWIARWLLWSSVPLVLYPFVRDHGVPRSLAIFLGLSWYFAIVSGVDPRVFGGPAPPEWLAYTHYAATGVVLLAASLTVLWLYRVLGAIWIVTSIAYGTTFLVSKFTDALDLPQVFIASETLLQRFESCSFSVRPAGRTVHGREANPVVLPIVVRERQIAHRHR